MMAISKELLDELLSGVERPEDLLGDNDPMNELIVRVMELMLIAELAEHPGYEPHGEADSQQTKRRHSPNFCIWKDCKNVAKDLKRSIRQPMKLRLNAAKTPAHRALTAMNMTWGNSVLCLPPP